MVTSRNIKGHYQWTKPLSWECCWCINNSSCWENTRLKPVCWCKFRPAVTWSSDCLIHPCSRSSLSLRFLGNMMVMPYWGQCPIQLQYNLLCQSTSWIGCSHHGLCQDNYLRALIGLSGQVIVYMDPGKAETSQSQCSGYALPYSDCGSTNWGGERNITCRISFCLYNPVCFCVWASCCCCVVVPTVRSLCCVWHGAAGPESSCLALLPLLKTVALHKSGRKAGSGFMCYCVGWTGTVWEGMCVFQIWRIRVPNSSVPH